MRILVGLTLILLLGGCTNASLKELRQVEPTGTPFERQLADYYLMLAEDEQAEGRHRNAQLAAEKGLASAYGTRVFAEPPHHDAHYHGQREALTKGRELLDEALPPDATTRLPELTAKMQTLYDCWLMRARANATPDRITLCKQQFYNQVRLVRHRLDEARADDPAAAADMPAPQPKPDAAPPASAPETSAKAPERAEPSLSTSYLIYFAWNRASLNQQAIQKLRDVATELLAIDEPYDVVLNGHTDTSGPDDYNMTLSERRAMTVRDVLVAFGVPADIIQVFAFGETDPAAATGDGVREPANRRVELFIE